MRDLNEEVVPIRSLRTLRPTTAPEKQIVMLALWPGLVAIVAAGSLGAIAASAAAGASAALGVAIVVANFTAAGLSVTWAARRSFSAFQAVALGGLLVRIALVLATLALLGRLPWVVEPALVSALVPALLLYVAAEHYLVFRTRLGRPLPILDGSVWGGVRR